MARSVGSGPVRATSLELCLLRFLTATRQQFYSYIRAAKAAGMRQIEVPVTTLNEIVRTSNVPFPDMVKIDAEGFDLKVLAGASELLGKTDIFLLEATDLCGTTIFDQISKTLWGT